MGSSSPEAQLIQPPNLTIDGFIKKLGNPGRYQIVVMILLSTNYIPVVTNHILMAFYSAKTPHHCKIAEDAEKEKYLPYYGESNNSSDFIYDQCQMYADPANHSAGTTQSFLSPLITTTYFCGVMIGGVIFGSASDRFGRKSTMLICLYNQCLIGIGIHFVRGLVLFIGLRFIQGIFIQGLQCVTYSMVMELFATEYRTLAGCVVEGFWAGGIVLLAVIAKYVQHWRYIQLAINIPTLATIFFIWIIPESVRWLISKGKYDKAEGIVSSILGYNSLSLDLATLRREMEAIGGAPSSHKRNPNFTVLLRIPNLRLRCLILFFIWFSVNLCYYGITYYIPNLYGDKYLNMIMGGGIELAAYILAFVILRWLGRQGPLCGYLLISGFMCVSLVLVKTFLETDVINVESLVIGLALIGKASIVSCFCTIFIYSSEIFPTILRTVGVGCCTFFGRVGSLLAPQVLLAGQYLYADSPALVPFLVFGGLCLISALLTCILPETLDANLPDTVEDALLQGMKERQGSSESLDIGYGKCPEFVCVDGLIVSRESGDWRDVSRASNEWREEHANTDTEQSFISGQGTLTTLRSRRSSRHEPDYEVIPDTANKASSLRSLNLPTDKNLSQILKGNAELLNSSRQALSSSGPSPNNLNQMSDGMNRLLASGHEDCPSQDSSVVSAQHSLVYTDSSVYATSTLYNDASNCPAVLANAAVSLPPIPHSVSHRLGQASSSIVQHHYTPQAAAVSQSLQHQVHQQGQVADDALGAEPQNSQTQNQTKDNLVNEMVKQKLLMLESNDETRL